ncbi:putative X8 domain-containing protein [Arabidopsis thaliana]|uniref:X8 domain-containing protein n=4 Tax=Arabidopsis TaxID=3701 RepID=A0A178UBR4_ARATH|nr:Carbohydrate-binding X8 domain superfamily protein [Arabidopsis thaliana]KAG7607114.1 X8 domain [Arabidopsis thaliana x Arabidopsis arenosa]KAG7614028.1 X8 domain [Arabidopsis suecica]AED97721.1 Carbohydrate-binding X8 domain superfamily protein [Arabidopsis thaliana]OAO90552.1 hypothetical protein AXX17_AT5G62810 [Arabidopsis thaliana]CAA0411693.1 unnamed protein product [Arabidopsis thaliana]|eukprot:NP_201128.2 Carbohydrate-binding X8 domain superfamily protein [Arabidopsis thaliana]
MSSLQLLTLLLLISTVSIPVVTCRQWCTPMPNTSDEQLQANIDFACSNGVDCTPIQPGGNCYNPNTLFDHASYVMNAYYHSHGRVEDACRFNRSGCFVVVDPSKDSCVYYT